MRLPFQRHMGRICLSAFASVLCMLGGIGCNSADTAGTQQQSGGSDVGAPGAAGFGGGALPGGDTNPGSIGPGNGTTGGTSTGVASIPCAVDTVVQSNCWTCHGATPIAGAPMSLMTLAQFQSNYTPLTTTQLKGQTMKLYELARIRINHEMGTAAMPQGRAMAPADFDTLNSWLTMGAPAGTACGAGSAGGGNTSGAGTSSGTGSGTGTGTNSGGTNDSGTGTGGTGGTAMGTGGATAGDGTGPSDQCNIDPTTMQPLVADASKNETCYEFQVHGTSGTTDTSKFTIQPGEDYAQYYYAIPWPANTVATRFGARYDNIAVLHHWLAFAEATPAQPAGGVVPNVTGTTLGESAELIGGWAIGGCNTVMPDDVGIKLPDSGEIMVQWHHFNSTGSAQQDGTAVQFCTAPASSRAHIAGLTFLGTENMSIPPGQTGTATGSCINNSGAPITIMGFTPHMHTIGVHMTSVVTKQGGAMETVFDQPFVFDSQDNYMLHPPYVLQPGDTITSTCTFDNTTNGTVGFGQSTTQEMCYQFTLAYPYGALNNGVLSLIGATNTCWQLGE